MGRWRHKASKTRFGCKLFYFCESRPGAFQNHLDLGHFACSRTSTNNYRRIEASSMELRALHSSLFWQCKAHPANFVGGAFTFISVPEVATARVFYFRAAVTSSAEMKVKAKKPPTKLPDKTIWNPRPGVDLASRAVGTATPLVKCNNAGRCASGRTKAVR